MSIVIVLAVIVGIVILLILLISHLLFTRYVINNFERCNCIVAGKKGTGKDLLFQWVINKRKKPYYANIRYSKKGDKKCKIVKIKDVSCAPNDYNAIVNDNIVKQPHKFKEKNDIYISDIGVFLPSYMDSKLYVKFPSMPILYALSRHLYSNNIHCNTQNIERGWKALREQADFYCICKHTTKLFGCIFITKVITYDKYESARQGLLPLKARFINKYSRAEVDLYKAQNGDIRQGHIIQLKRKLYYDTRAFEKILLKGCRKY